MPATELLKALEDQLAFFDSGGYGFTYRNSWRPTLVIRDSPLCLHATFTPTPPCRECILFPMIPEEKKHSLIPCHHIPLNAAGETLATMYDKASQEQLDRTFHAWLCATIQNLKGREATAMKTLERTTAISFKNILFLTDFTPASDAAFTYALAAARHFCSRLYAGHAIVPFMATELEVPVMPDILNQLESDKRLQLEGLVEKTGVSNSVLVTQQDLEVAVPRWINEHGIDLIVMGTHGRKGVDRFFLGSAAEAIVRTATCPVLTVGPGVTAQPRDLHMEKILFATSLSKESDPAVAYALSFARERQADLMVLHALPDPAETQDDWKVLADIARDKMKALVPLDEVWPRGVEFFVEPGDAASRILEYAKGLSPDLIVLGLTKEPKTSTHFRRGVAYKVISAAPCAVLTVR